MKNRLLFILSVASAVPAAQSFTAPASAISIEKVRAAPLFSDPIDADLGEKFGGFTTKQRLREEIESPFRKVRLAFFSFSAVSAFVALYFSALVSVHGP